MIVQAPAVVPQKNQMDISVFLNSDPAISFFFSQASIFEKYCSFKIYLKVMRGMNQHHLVHI